jgi:hypothetical protein
MNKDLLHNLFTYCDGSLFVKNPQLRSKYKFGDKAGTLNKNGYRVIRISGKVFLEHRLIWLMHYGKLPTFIDHINGIRNDNRIENLRESTLTQNQQNKKLSKANTTGFKNVYFHKKSKLYRVSIRFNGKKLQVASLHDIELADLVAQMAREKYHKNFCRHF